MIISVLWTSLVKNKTLDDRFCKHAQSFLQLTDARKPPHLYEQKYLNI